MVRERERKRERERERERERQRERERGREREKWNGTTLFICSNRKFALRCVLLASFQFLSLLEKKMSRNPSRAAIAINLLWFWSLSFDLRELCIAGEAWKFVSDLENLRCNEGSYTSCGFGTLYAFFLVTSVWDDFWQTFQCTTNFWICFSWSVRQTLSDKVRL